jgi:hypothetical protein
MSTLATLPRRADLGCRVCERFPCELPTACQPVASRNDKDLVWSGTIRDISVGGVGIVLSRRFEPGMGLQIELPGSEPGMGETLLARVVYVRRLPEGWLLGCSFISQLSEHEIEELLRLGRALREPGSDPAADEPDDHTALVGSPNHATADHQAPAVDSRTTAVIATVTFQSEPVNGRIVRLKLNRLVVTGSWPPAPGTVLRIKAARPDADPEADKVRVTRTWQEAGRWMVGYQFVGRPSAGLLRHFGHEPKK